MIKLVKYCIATGILAILMAGFYQFAINSVPNGMESKAEIGGDSRIITKIKNIELIERNSTGDIWKLKANEVLMSNLNTLISNVRMSYKSKVNDNLQLTADRGEIDSLSQNVLFSGNVNVFSPRPLKLSTESLVWKPDERTLTSNSYVNIESQTAVIDGTGLVIDVEGKDMKILSSVKAVLF